MAHTIVWSKDIGVGVLVYLYSNIPQLLYHSTVGQTTNIKEFQLAMQPNLWYIAFTSVPQTFNFISHFMIYKCIITFPLIIFSQLCR